MPQVFLSYAHGDLWIYRSVIASLKYAGVEVWSDNDLSPGSKDWQTEIEKRIEESKCLIALLTPNSKLSQWVREEVNYAQNCHVPILPLLCEGDQRTSVPLGIGISQYIDIRTDFIAGIDKLIKALRKEYNVNINTQSETSEFRFERTGSLFWLSKDFFESKQLLEALEIDVQASFDTVRQFAHHVSRLYPSEEIKEQLKGLLEKLDQKSSAELKLIARKQIIFSLDRIYMLIAREAELNDLDWDSGPRWHKKQT